MKFFYGLFVFFILISVNTFSQNFENTQGELPEFFAEYMHNGSGINGTDSAKDHSGATADYYFQPAENESIRIYRLIIAIEDNNIDNTDDYGAITGGLDHGLAFIMRQNGIERRIDGSKNTTTNGDFHKIAYEVDIANLGNGGDYLTIEWEFDKAGTVLRLNGSTNDSFIIRIHDDLSPLTSQFFKIQGYIEKDLKKKVLKVEEVNIDNMLPIIILQISLIIFFILIGVPFKEGFLKLFSWGIALIELIITVWLVYINEAGGSILSILWFNSISMLIVGGALGFLSILMIQTRLMLDDTTEDDAYTKFILRSPRSK